MARAKNQQQPARNISAADALHAICLIDGSLDAICKTAPKTLAAIGGRDAIKRMCEMTCIGAVPRLTIEQWTAMAAEHAEHQKETEFKDTVAGGVSGKAEATDRRGTSSFSSSVRGRGLVR